MYFKELRNRAVRASAHKVSSKQIVDISVAVKISFSVETCHEQF